MLKLFTQEMLVLQKSKDQFLPKKREGFSCVQEASHIRTSHVLDTSPKYVTT